MTLPGLAIVAVLATAVACGSTTSIYSQVSCTGKKALSASGSSAQLEAMNAFSRTYSATCRGRTLDYRSTGSAAGRRDFINGNNDFGGTDSPLGRDAGEYSDARARCGGHDAWNLPSAFSAVAIIYNVAGVDSLVLDGPTAAKIFNGSIRTWNAPEIAALNSGQDLPDEAIVVIFRSDESGTTGAFQDYLGVASGGVWREGGGETFNGIRGRAAKGNEGAWTAIKRTPWSITYSAWPFARKYGLPTAKLVTPAASRPVELSAESVGAAVTSMQITGRGNDLVLDTTAVQQPTRLGAYPIVLTTYEVVCSRYPDPQTSTAVRDFLTVALEHGQRHLPDLGYAPVPQSLKDRLRAAVADIGAG